MLSVLLCNSLIKHWHIHTQIFPFIQAAFSRLETQTWLYCAFEAFLRFINLSESKWKGVFEMSAKCSFLGQGFLASSWAVEDSRLNLLNRCIRNINSITNASPSSCEHKEWIKFKCKFNSRSKTNCYVNAFLTYYTACGHSEMLPRQHLKLQQSLCLFEAGIKCKCRFWPALVSARYTFTTLCIPPCVNSRDDCSLKYWLTSLIHQNMAKPF